MTAKEAIKIMDERELIGLVMMLTGGSVNPNTVREIICRIKDEK